MIPDSHRAEGVGFRRLRLSFGTRRNRTPAGRIVRAKFGRRLGVIALMLAAAVSSPAYSQQKADPSATGTVAVAVWDFSRQGISETQGTAFTNRLRSELVNRGHFRVVTRDQVRTLLGEMELTQLLGDPRDAIQSGKLKGVRFVIAGTLVALPGATQITAELIDGTTGEILRSITPSPFRGDYVAFLDTQVPYIADQLAGIAATLPPPTQVERRPRWELYTGWGLLAVSLFLQYEALDTQSQAKTKAAGARNTQDFSKYYNDASAKNKDAQTLQAEAIWVGVAAVAVLVDYYANRGARAPKVVQEVLPDREAGRPEWHVSVQANSLQMGAVWRW